MSGDRGGRFTSAQAKLAGTGALGERPHPRTIRGIRLRRKRQSQLRGWPAGTAAQPCAGLTDGAVPAVTVADVRLRVAHHVLYKDTEGTDSGYALWTTALAPHHHPPPVPAPQPGQELCPGPARGPARLSCPDFFNSEINRARLMSSPVTGCWRI